MNSILEIVTSLRLTEPLWLVGLVLVPWVVLLSRRSLAGLGPSRKWTAIALRCLLVVLIVLALAEPRLQRPQEHTTVLFVLDRSLSIPPEPEPETGRDRRWDRVKRFVSGAVGRRSNPDDRAGIIAFGRRPRLVLSPSTATRLDLADDQLGTVDPNATDIAAALKLALASFPEGTSRRVVLVSDGNENLGNALDTARGTFEGVPIDVVPLAAGYRNDSEVLVQSVEAPPRTQQGARLPIRVLVRNASPSKSVEGVLTLQQISEGRSVDVPILPGAGVIRPAEGGRGTLVRLRPGLNPFSFRQQLGGDDRSYTYEARFEPLAVRDDETGDVVRGRAPGDRVQNDSAATHVVALGRRRVLFIEPAGRPELHQRLVDRLGGEGPGKFRIDLLTSDRLPLAPADLGVFLSNYDCVILGDVPAEELTDAQQEMIRRNTYDQGSGLVVVGGSNSYGAGGYQGTAIEKALPVDCDIKALQVAGKGGLVLIMHASEMAEGNYWQKEIAKLAIKKLGAIDMAGVLYYNSATTWHVPFQAVGPNRAGILRLIDRMMPGDMPDFDPFLVRAYDTLSNPKYELATKLCIVISDGDPSQGNARVLANMKQAGIKCTTVGVATHGAPENTRLENMARATGGRFYNPKNPKQLPAIYIKETRSISQSFVHEKQFDPQLRIAGGPTEKLPANLPPLHGFVRTTLKPSPLALMAIEGPATLDQQFPILAYWQYGLGRTVAFTSDASTPEGVPPPPMEEGPRYWDRDWAGSDLYLKFWEQVVGWALRGLESGRLAMTTEHRDGKVRVILDARDAAGMPIVDLQLNGRVTPPDGSNDQTIDLRFEQTNSGQYEAEFDAEDAGSYFVTAQATRRVPVLKDGKPVLGPDGQPLYEQETDGVRTGVTVPYSAEFADLESNTRLMEQLAEATGGEVIPEALLDRPDTQRQVFRPAPVGVRSLQPIWPWLAFAAACVLVLDIAVRRIALEPAAAWAWTVRQVARWRGQPTVAPTPAFLERLKGRKEQVDQAIQERTRSAPRIEPRDDQPPPPPPTGDLPPPPRPAPKPPPAPAPTAGGDYMSKLREAKRRAMEERQKAGGELPPEG